MENLRRLREKTGLSQQKVADQTGLTQQKLHTYETGTFEPDISTLKVLADFFETSVDYLVGHTENPRKIEPVEEYALNAEERALVDRYRDLLPNQRRSLDLFLDSLENK